MQAYLDLIRHILEEGAEKGDRTGTGTLSTFGYQMRFDLSEGFPMVTTKKLHLKSIVHELLWFLKGDTNVKYLQDNGVRIWNEWADEDGNLGPVYGKQWRKWETTDGRVIDQIEDAIKLINENPSSRRIIVSAWNVGDLNKMALQPCHVLFQLYTQEMSKKEITDYEWIETKRNRKISLHLYQRSCDVGLGLPFNIGSYALLLCMFADQLNMVPDQLVMSFGDVHIYNNHLDKLQAQIERDPKPSPYIYLNPDIKSMFDYSPKDIKLIKYNTHPHIKMDVSV